MDHDYPLAMASLGLAAGARHYLIVSSMGASAGSRIFYNRTKGEVEDAIRALPYRSVTIARPSLLLGEREQRRRGEEIGAMLSFLTPKRYKPIRAEVVARALVELAVLDARGVAVVESMALQRIGASGI